MRAPTFSRVVRGLLAFGASAATAVASVAAAPAPETTRSTENASAQESPPPQACFGLARSLAARATDKEKVGQLFIPWVTMPTDGGPTEVEKRRIQELGYGFFNFNGGALLDTEHAARYTNQLQEWAADTRLGIPVMPAMDMEIGSAHRFAEVGPGQGQPTPLPYPMGLGASRDLGAAATSARITAEEARAVGFSMNIAPVADVNTNPLNPVIGVRSFSEQTGLVSDMIVEQVKAYQDNGVIAMPKHFPGHGDTSVDSHLGLPTVDYDRQTLEEVHLAPFEAAIDAGADSIMTAHVVVEAIDDELPATLSEKVLTGLLREEMGFDGLIVTDSMSMDAIRDEWGTGDAAVMAFQAGADMIMDSDQESYDAVLDAVRSGEISTQRINESVQRIIQLKCEYGLFADRYVDPAEAEAAMGTDANRDAARDIGRDGVTLVANHDDTLPLSPGDHRDVLVTGVTHGGNADQIPDLAAGIEERTGSAVEDRGWAFGHEPDEAVIADVVAEAEGADVAVVGTFSRDRSPPYQTDLVQRLADTDTPVVVVSLGLPYELEQFGDVDAAVATYAIDLWGTASPTPILAALDVLAGSQPGGRLPVTVGDDYPFGHGLGYSSETWISVAERVTEMRDEQLIHRSDAAQLDTHLSTGQRLADSDDGAGAARSLDRALSVAEDVDDADARAELVSLLEELREQL